MIDILSIHWTPLLFFMVFLLFFLHPFLFYPASLRLIILIKKFKDNSKLLENKADSKKRNTAPLTGVAVLVCARNEELVIKEKIKNILNLNHDGINLSINIFNDASTDKTLQKISEIKHFLNVISVDSQVGKSVGMNSLVKSLQKEKYIVFTDANTMMDESSVINAVDYLESMPNVGLVAGVSQCSNAKGSKVAKISEDYWNLDVMIKDLEGSLEGIIGADGAFFVMRREIFSQVPHDIIDDFYTSMKVVLSGKKAIQLKSCIVYEKNVTNNSGEFRRKTRIACRAYNCYRLLKKDILSMSPLFIYCFYSHKWLRWHGFTFFVLSLISLFFLLESLFGILAVLGLMFGMTAFIIAGLKNIPVLSIPMRVISLIYAVNLGVWKSFLGEKYAVWNPDQSSR